MKKYFLSAALMICLSACSSTRYTPATKNKSVFSNHELSLIQSAKSDVPMRVFKINNHSDSLLLRTQSTDVDLEVADETLSLFASRMYATVRDSMSLGVGIAAPQVGILKNMIWVQRFDKEDAPFEFYINPKILQYSTKKQSRREGCLSIPDRRDTLNCRSYAIMIEYDMMDESHHIEMVEDFTAIIFQHEIDHLNGILYTDHLEKELQESRE